MPGDDLTEEEREINGLALMDMAREFALWDAHASEEMLVEAGVTAQVQESGAVKLNSARRARKARRAA